MQYKILVAPNKNYKHNKKEATGGLIAGSYFLQTSLVVGDRHNEQVGGAI